MRTDLTKENAIKIYGEKRGHYLVEVYIDYAGVCMRQSPWIWGIYKGKRNAMRQYKEQCKAAKDAAKDGIFTEESSGVAFKMFKHTVPTDHVFKFTDWGNGLPCNFRIHTVKL